MNWCCHCWVQSSVIVGKYCEINNSSNTKHTIGVEKEARSNLLPPPRDRLFDRLAEERFIRSSFPQEVVRQIVNKVSVSKEIPYYLKHKDCPHNESLENVSLKKSDVVTSNAEIYRCRHSGTHQIPVPYSYSLIFQLYPLASNFGQVVLTKRCKCDTSYLSLTFTSTGDEEAPDAVCFFIRKILANSSLAPGKLLRHLEKNYPTDKGKDVTFLKEDLKAIIRA
ncbi:zinc finger BED domain-containing protein 5 [Trichonephila clavata]|uniref:Zinc finger BED domain-containing protein 5 n=1 Tax=Trichonephila clavata TaxID=2740835 RepID=A0A8X6LVE5_TRICU|nr:zinc finger BED domain-containing protein 5 [Trichonephila clavata]